MTKLVAWAGNAYFAESMRELGYDSVLLPHAAMIGWPEIVACCGRQPDLLIYGDISAPPFLRGLESFPCPTIFYAIDTHIHSWYPRYAQAFDLCCVAMRDHLPGFLGQRLQSSHVLWLPLFSREQDRLMPTAEPMTDQVLFVGKNDPVLTPGRFQFLKDLGRRVSLTVRQGWYPELYARANLVLNVSEHHDLNFRVFEALGCAACLLTPRVGHGLLELFRDGEDLFMYDPEDIDGLVELIGSLLRDEGRRTQVARTGHATVLRGHRASHRARTLCEWIDGIDVHGLVHRRLEGRGQIFEEWLRLLYLHFAETEESEPRAAMYLRDFARSGPSG